MKRDFTLQVFHKNLELKYRKVEITLTKKTIRFGIIIGLYMGNKESGDPYILSWHLVDEKDIANVGMDYLGFLRGHIISNKVISEIKFLEDGTVIIFNSN